MADPDRDTLLRMFETMAKIYAADTKMRAMVMAGQATFLAYWSPRGQEAISAGVGAHLRSNDYLVTTYRGLHDHVAKGVPLPELFAEWLGRSTGLCKGKGGGMHISHPESGMMVTTGVVGGGLPIANGLALASVLRGEDRVTVVNFGDGACNIGSFHEALNLASLWRLPVVFCCQNNGYAEHSLYATGTSVGTIAERGPAYGMKSVTVDGNDPRAVYAAAGEAIALARAGGGPTLLEALTYHLVGHFAGDDLSHIPADELAAAKAADPVPRYRDWLVAGAHASDEELREVEQRLAKDVEAAWEFASSSPYPDNEELYRDVYAEGIRP